MKYEEREYVISSGDREIGRVTAGCASDALDFFCSGHPDEEIGHQRGGLTLDLRTQGLMGASVRTDGGVLDADAIDPETGKIAHQG